MGTKIIALLTFSLFLMSSNLNAQSIAYKLAVLEKGGYVSENDASVKRFENLLSQLDSKYQLGKQKIADMTYKIKEVSNDRGLKVSLIKVMEGASQIDSKNYAEYLGMYLTLLEKGYKHDEILDSIKLYYLLGLDQ